MTTDLSLIGELDDEATDGERGLIGEAVIDALGAHVTGEDAAIGGEAGDGDADVVVDLEDLLLVGGELGVGLVDAGQHHVGLGSEADRRRPLLHRLHRVLNLEQPPRRAPCRDVRVVLVPEHRFSSMASFHSLLQFTREQSLSLSLSLSFAFIGVFFFHKAKSESRASCDWEHPAMYYGVVTVFECRKWADFLT